MLYIFKIIMKMSLMLVLSVQEAGKFKKTKWVHYFDTPCKILVPGTQGVAVRQHPILYNCAHFYFQKKKGNNIGKDDQVSFQDCRAKCKLTISAYISCQERRGGRWVGMADLVLRVVGVQVVGGNILGSGEEGRGLTGADQHQKREWGYSHWSRLKARTESGGTVTGGADWSSSAPECTGAE